MRIMAALSSRRYHARMRSTNTTSHAIVGCVLAAGLTISFSARAQAPQIPLASDEKSTVYVTPNVSSTENAMQSKGGTVGVLRPDGSSTYTGVDTSGTRPNYSIGASTGGDVSFSAGASSDGKDNKGVKAGVTIKY